MTTPAALPLDPTQVQIGTNNGPGIYLAPEGTASPLTIDDPWDAPWVPLGYLDAAGPVVGQTSSTTDITPWQSVVPIRTLMTARGVTLQFVMWQLNPLTLSLYFDADPTNWDNSSTDIDMQVRSDTPQHTYAVGIDAKDRERIFRLSFTRANLSAVANMAISRGAAIPLDVTLATLDDGGALARLQIGTSTVTGAAAPLGKSAGRRASSAADREHAMAGA